LIREAPYVNEKFAELGMPRRIWAIAALHGDVDRLSTLHDHIASRFNVRDRIVYLGNYLGIESRTNRALLDEMLAFRAALLSKTGIEPTDIVYLRGPAEEAWQRLLRLQFAPVPTQALDKALASGVEAYLRLYGVSVNDTKSMARAGSVAITRWTNQMRMLQRSVPGHETLMSSMRRAAYTHPGSDQKRFLFVPAGFDSSRSLEEQGEALWWTSVPFHLSGRAQNSFSRIVRGFDSVNGGTVLDEAAVTLDGGCGRGGPLFCAGFAPTGKLIDLIAVGGQGAIEQAPFEREIANDSYAIDDSQLRALVSMQEFVAQETA
jgi:serine/threonine protein phosphatase 1